MSAVEQAIAEIDDRLHVLGPEIEGLRDFVRLDLQDATRAELTGIIQRFERRIIYLKSARSALQQLLDDGHPDVSLPPISAEALADLEAEAEEIQLALGLFQQSTTAATLGLRAGAVAPKP